MTYRYVNRTPPDPETQSRTRELVDRLRLAGAARQLGLSRIATSRIAAGAACNPGTLALARQRLAELVSQSQAA